MHQLSTPKQGALQQAPGANIVKTKRFNASWDLGQTGGLSRVKTENKLHILAE
jgi:hypothetical protein